MHLKCNRRSHRTCLEWTEICDGHIDCLDNGIDEEHYWQLEINECKDNEYRCPSEQYIPQLFIVKKNDIPDCVDASDIKKIMNSKHHTYHESSESSVGCEDITCTSLKLSQISMMSSCDIKRRELLIEAIYSNNNNSTSPDCWSAFKSLIEFQRSKFSTCNTLCKQNDFKNIVMNRCPNVLFFPNTPVLFGNIYFVYKKDDLQNRTKYLQCLYLD